MKWLQLMFIFGWEYYIKALSKDAYAMLPYFNIYKGRDMT